MKLFTSRYTASLEQQVQELKADKARLEKQVESLTLSNNELMRIAITTPPVRGTAATAGDKKESPLPKAVNWLQARGSLESTNHKITEAEPKETAANGSR